MSIKKTEANVEPIVWQVPDEKVVAVREKAAMLLEWAGNAALEAALTSIDVGNSVAPAEKDKALACYRAGRYAGLIDALAVLGLKK